MCFGVFRDQNAAEEEEEIVIVLSPAPQSSPHVEHKQESPRSKWAKMAEKIWMTAMGTAIAVMVINVLVFNPVFVIIGVIGLVLSVVFFLAEIIIEKRDAYSKKREVCR